MICKFCDTKYDERTHLCHVENMKKDLSSVKQERDRYKKALEEIYETTASFSPVSLPIHIRKACMLAREVLEGKGGEALKDKQGGENE